MENEFITYQNLMKEATKYKKVDIDKSISIIRNAIDSCQSCARFEGNFRLIKYLAIAKKHGEISVEFNDLLNGINLKYDIEPFCSHSTIYLGMSDYYAKEKDFGNAFYYAVLSYWNAVVRTAFSGKDNHLEYLLSDKYEYPVISKLAKKNQIIDADKIFKYILKVISSFSDELKIIAKLNRETESLNKFLEPPYYDNESYDFRVSRLLNENNEYRNCVKVVREINFELEYKNNISVFTS